MDAIITAIILSLSTNLDNLAVGMTCGVKDFTIRLPANLLIALLSGTSTYASMQVGNWLDRFIPAYGAQWLGSGILVAIGLLSLLEVVQGKESEISSLSSWQLTPRMMSLREAGILGLVLTISNWGTGIGAGIAQLNLGLTCSCSFFSSLLTIGGGAFLGRLALQNLPGKGLTGVAGLLLIGLGIYEGLHQIV